MLAVLLFTTAWSVLPVADDGAGWPPDLGPRLDGAWVVAAPGPNGPLVHHSFNTAQDSEGLRYTTVVEHTQCSASVWGAFPQANAQSLQMGLTEKTGPNTSKGTGVSYGLKVGGVEDEVIYIAVNSWDTKQVDEDHSTIKATLSYYLPQQSACSWAGDPITDRRPKLAHGGSRDRRRSDRAQRLRQDPVLGGGGY